MPNQTPKPEAKPLPVCSVAFAGAEPYPLPENVISSEFRQLASGDFCLDYIFLEKDSNGSMLLPDRKRKVKESIYFSPDGFPLATCTVPYEWEADTPSLSDVLKGHELERIA